MIEEALYVIAKAHPGLTGLIGSGDNIRLYPDAKDKPTLPALIYAKGDPDPIAGIWQDSGWYHTVFSFTALGSSAKAAKEVIVQARAAFQRYHSNGAVVAGTDHKVDDVEALPTGQDYYDHELDCFAEEIELEFFHN